MARSDYEGAPQVGADTSAPDDYQHVQTNDDAFGGAIARGVESAATDINHLYTQTAADDATNQLQQYTNTILNGHPGQGSQGPDGQMVPDTGFLGKRGADAMRAAPQALSDLDEKIQEIREGLPTREAQFQFDQESRRYRFNWQAQISSHAREQQYTWAKSVNSVSEQTALNKIGSAPEDSDQFVQGVTALRKAYKNQAALDGLDPSEAEMRADQNATLTRVRALLPTNPTMAQQVFDANTKILGGLPNYDAIANQVKTGVINATIGPAADTTVAGAMASAQSMVGVPGKAPAPGFDSAWQFTLNHEGGYSAHDANGQPVNFGINQGAHPNVDVSKLTPETAKPLAKPYWNDIHGDTLPANMQGPAFDTAFIFGPKVANEMIAQAGGDPNKLIDLSAQRMQHLIDKEPAKFDKYREAWEKRNNDLRAQVNGGGQTYPSTADAINANYATTMQAAQEYAQKEWPQYPDAQERYLSHVDRGLQRTVAQQERMHEVNVHTVQQALLGPHAPTSEAELLSSGPQIASAWQDMRVNNPMAAMSVERVFDANAKGKAGGFGKQFNSMLMDRVLAPANDPHRVKTASDIWPYVKGGEDAPITNTGLDALSGVLQQRGTPQGEAQVSQLRSFFQKARKALSDQDPHSGIFDPKGEERFTHFVANALPNIKAEMDAGKQLSEILAEKGPIATSVGIYDRTPTQRMKDRIMGHGGSTADQSPQAQQAAMAAGFQKSYASAQNDQQRQEVIEDARRNGFIFRPKQAPQQPNPNAPPEVPRPAQLVP